MFAFPLAFAYWFSYGFAALSQRGVLTGAARTTAFLDKWSYFTVGVFAFVTGSLLSSENRDIVGDAADIIFLCGFECDVSSENPDIRDCDVIFVVAFDCDDVNFGAKYSCTVGWRGICIVCLPKSKSKFSCLLNVLNCIFF